MNEHQSILEQMLQDMDTADALYRPTQFWRIAADRLIDEVERKGLNRFRSMAGPLSYFVPTYGFPGFHADNARFDNVRSALSQLSLGDSRCMLHLERLLSGEAQAESDYRVLVAADRGGAPHLDQFSESEVGEPIEQFKFDGRLFSRSSLNYLIGLAFLKIHCDLSDVKVVLEIGGGFGSLGEILLSDARNNYFYVDVDIPPTIHVATRYLTTLYGAAAVLGYKAAREMDCISLAEVAQVHKAAMLASWQLPKLVGTIDLFVNFISFQEMEPEIVRNYLAQVDRLCTRFVLLRNIREGKAKSVSKDALGVREPTIGGMYDMFLQNYTLKSVNTMPFGYQTVDGFHSELRLYERR